MSTTGSNVEDLPLDEESRQFSGEYGEEVVQEEESLVLNSEDFISGPFFSEQCTLPDDILQLRYSYGYDCKRLYNLVAPDEDTLIFASGNLIHFFNVITKELWFRRSYLGGGIGHITVNPNKEYPHLAVAENGDNPPIIIYEWPSMDIVGILKEGAAKRYAHINYSPDGELLVSQSYGPDFLITVWKWKNWRRSPIVLRTKSHVNDVYRVMFSPYVPGQITTGGSGHIKFWKMALTFTGLKLQGELGRFGKTEISDITGIYPMPDEKVISGSEWGNLLVWEEGLIKIEVFRTLRRRCHLGPVMQLEYDREQGEIWSVSQDGWLRAWEYRFIDEADPPDEDRVVQMVPSYERETPGVQFLSVCKKNLYEMDNTFYYAQDGNGGIWVVDLILKTEYEPSVQLKSCHAGAVADISACPWSTYLASLGVDGRLIVYNYLTESQLYVYQFPAKGRTLMWLPLLVDPTGSLLIMGFDDGVVRVCVLQILSDKEINLVTVQSIKPHNKPVTKVSINPQGTLLVTGGEDKTIFVFELTKKSKIIVLKPIGFVFLNTIVTCFTWHPTMANVLLAGCMHGELFEFNLPEHSVDYTQISYFLHTVQPKQQHFTTCKAQIRRDLHIKEIEAYKAEKLERKKQEIIQIKLENPGLEIDEEAYLADSDTEEVLEPLYIPEIPNRIWFTMYTPENTIWLSMGGYDAGYIYEYQMDQTEVEPLRATIVEDGDDIEMQAYLYSFNGKYLFTSMQNGAIRVNRVNPDNFRDLSDYWLLTMHDNFNGEITRICFSFDNKFFFSSGTDGNIFSYKFNPEDRIPYVSIGPTEKLPQIPAITTDEGYQSLSLEEMMIKAEQDKQLRLANEHKRKLRQRLKELTIKLTSLLERNCDLPKSQRYTLRNFVIDDRIMKALDDTLEAKVALERRKLAYDVERSTVALRKFREHYVECLDLYPIKVSAIKSEVSVSLLQQRSLGELFFETFDTVEKKMEEEALRGRMPQREAVVTEAKLEKIRKPQDLEPFLVGMSPSTIAFKMGAKLTRMLKKYRIRRARREKRQEEWNEFNAKKPAVGVNHPTDIQALEFAKITVGDFKMKSAPNYKVPEELQESTVKKYQEILETRLRSYKLMVHAFDRDVYKLRNHKIELIKKLEHLKKRLDKIHEELPERRKRYGPPIPEMTDADFPEKYLELKINVEKDYLKKKKEKKVEVEAKEEENEDEDCDFEKEILKINKLPDLNGNHEEIIRSTVKKYNMKIDIEEIPAYMESLKVGTDTIWETELITKRLIHKIYEQDRIIFEMNQSIDDFDKAVREMHQKRYKVRAESTFIDLHLLMLNQELVIVKDCELFENELKTIARDHLTEMLDMRDAITLIDNKIEVQQSQIEVNQDQIKDIQQTFLLAVKENKFWDFLRRIFKKKYKPPKVYNPDESDSSSISSESSTESEEDELTSIDSRDLGPIRLDESVCPKGCDKELYDYTFTLRSQRHELEKSIKEEQKAIEVLRKELEGATKKMKVVEQTSTKSTDELEEYQRMKQKKLNEVMTTTILKLSQMQHLIPGKRATTKMSDVLVISAPQLTKLYARVGELQRETLEERARHKKNKFHLHRMNVDCQYMQQVIKNLRNEISEAMFRKFGRKIDIDDLEEAILKRMVLELRLALLNIKSLYEKDIQNLRDLYGEKQVELKNTIRENTARLEVLAVLNKEKAELDRFLLVQAQKKEKFGKKDDTYFFQDIDKLTAVVQSQKEQMQALKAEIKKLSTKSSPPKPIMYEPVPEVRELEEPREVCFMDFGSLDEDYVPPEEVLNLTPYMTDEQQQVTEEDVQACIIELIKELAEESSKIAQTTEEVMIKIISDVIEQIPQQYLAKTASVEYISGLIKEVVGKVGEIKSEAIVTKISEITRRPSEEIRQIAESIIQRVFEEKDEEVINEL